MSPPAMRPGLIFLLMLTISTRAIAQTAGTAVLGSVAENNDTLNQTVLQHLRDDELVKALDSLGGAKTAEGLSGAAGGLHRALAQLGSDEQYELLHKWSMPAAGQNGVRVLTSLVPEVAPPMEFARALGLRPKKESFSLASVGDMPGIFCSAWMMIVAADDVGNLRKLITELEALAAKKTVNAAYVLTLARLRDTRTSDDELQSLLTARVAGEGDLPQPANLSDAVLVAAAIKREAVKPVCEQIVERLNQFDFAAGTSPSVSFLRRLRATVILKSRAADVDPATVLYDTPEMWVAADDQNHQGNSTGADRAIWLTHEEHIKRLAGPGDDLLLFKYPLTGTFELKGEVTALDHGGAGLSYGGFAFDANQEKFTVKEVQRPYFESRIWPFVAPKELRMFNRVNIRSSAEGITFLSNLHPGWDGTPASCASCPWLASVRRWPSLLPQSGTRRRTSGSSRSAHRRQQRSAWLDGDLW
ncbi:MAG: hypothetical protein O2856_13525 [Planctomycetota bacterium]|nr:hypothetical protein [Planctomycetota bacterium]